MPGQRKWAHFIKRFIDLLICIPVLILLSPLFLILALVIRLDSPGRAFYNQDRIGYLAKPFTSYKFRTMYQDRSGIVLGLEVREDDDRITRIGRYLRRFKLDELPQLLNIVSGQMTIVGPRPDIPAQVNEYTDFQRQRLLVRPGLTGVAQVSSNIWMPWSERIVLDVWYIQNWSLYLDIRIVWHTFQVLLHGEKPDADPMGLRAALFGTKTGQKRELQENMTGNGS
jgi:lipopolysaccharide/colanic/teichoic acid biosynthesis glycosyltransferase